jgi:hypothetical protein
MIDPGAGVGMRGRVLRVLLVCLALFLVGCSGDPECFAVPFLPQCFDDDEEKTEDTAPQTSVRVPAGAEDLDTTKAALRQTLVGRDVVTLGEMTRHLHDNWLQVSGTAERSQIDQRVRHQLHAIVPLLDTFKAEQQTLARVLPGKGPLDTHPPRMDRGIEEALAPALGALAVAGILLDIGDEAGIENALAIGSGIKAAIEIDISLHIPRMSATQSMGRLPLSP